MCSWTEPEELAGDAFVARAADLRIPERHAQPEQLADGEHEPEIVRTGAGFDRHCDIDAIRGAAACGKRCPQPSSDGCLPAGVDAVRRVAGPHASHVQENRVTDVE